MSKPVEIAVTKTIRTVTVVSGKWIFIQQERPREGALDNPTVLCSIHAERFRRPSEEIDHDGTETLVKQYWEARCGCKVEITLVIPDTPDKPN